MSVLSIPAAAWRAGLALSAALALSASGAQARPPAKPAAAFEAPIAQGPKPWTHERFDDAPQSFSFAVVADLESGYRPGVFEVAVAELSLLRPAFIMTVGDMIEGGVEDEAELERQWTAFDAMVGRTPAPFFHVAGNHDMVNLTQRKVWERRYGRRYYHFLYKDVLFLVLDTEDYPDAKMAEISRERTAYLARKKVDLAAARKLPYAARSETRTGEISQAQSAYFEKVLADHPKVRWTVAIMHKPVYARSDGLGFGRIEQALQGRRYTVLNGHLHRYAYAEHKGQDYIMLGTTGGERAFDGSRGYLDHVMWITMGADGPSIANLRLDGVLDKTGEIPAGGAALCLGSGGPNCPVPTH